MLYNVTVYIDQLLFRHKVLKEKEIKKAVMLYLYNPDANAHQANCNIPRRVYPMCMPSIQLLVLHKDILQKGQVFYFDRNFGL